ncbi:MAG: DUF192 domain-containing protein [Nitrosopumilaceae archaeon]|nr:DUF192 domain-containing protein [Nitrosopumilaceae archaeon]
MKTSMLTMIVGFFLSVLWIGYLWIGYLSFSMGNEVMVDGITVSTTIVTTLSTVFSIVSWSLFSWATHNINSRGVMLSVIAGIAVIVPFSGDLGPMTAILVGIVTGFAAYMIQKKIENPTRNKPLVIGITTIVASYAVLFLMIVSVQSTVHVWDTGDGIDAWTGIQIDDVSLMVQIADTESKRVRGLMFQEQLPYDKGMLFVFEESGNYPIWMHNMKFPLDVIWFDKNGNAVHIEKNLLPCKTVDTNTCQRFLPSAEANYVLEVASGFVEKHRITKDSNLYLDSIPIEIIPKGAVIEGNEILDAKNRCLNHGHIWNNNDTCTLTSVFPGVSGMGLKYGKYVSGTFLENEN